MIGYSLYSVWVETMLMSKSIKVNSIAQLKYYNKDIIVFYRPTERIIDLSDCNDCINDAYGKGLSCPYFNVCYDSELLRIIDGDLIRFVEVE